MSRQLIALALLLLISLFGCKDNNLQPPDENALLTNPFIKPMVVSTTPANYSEGPYENGSSEIEIWFNKNMDRDSIRRALSFSIPNNEIVIDTNYILVYKNHVIVSGVFRAHNLNDPTFRVGQTYKLDVTTIAMDVNGNHLQSPFSLYFKPEPYFRVTAAYNLDPLSVYGKPLPVNSVSWEIEFNSPVDSTMLTSSSIYSSFTNGWHYTFSGYRNYISTFQSDLDFDRLYTVYIDRPFQDIYGNKLHEPVFMSFSTPPFAVRKVTPENGATDVPVVSTLEINFTGILDTSSVSSAFKIMPAIPGTLSVDNRGTIGFYLKDELDNQTTYTVNVSNALRARNGVQFPYSVNYSFTTVAFKVDRFFSNVLFIYGNDSTNIPRDLPIVFTLTGQCDTNSVKSAFSISPNVSHRFEFFRYYISPTHDIVFVPDSILQANTRYTITISDALLSKKGVHLIPYMKSFTTGN